MEGLIGGVFEFVNVPRNLSLFVANDCFLVKCGVCRAIHGHCCSFATGGCDVFWSGLAVEERCCLFKGSTWTSSFSRSLRDCNERRTFCLYDVFPYEEKLEDKPPAVDDILIRIGVSLVCLIYRLESTYVFPAYGIQSPGVDKLVESESQ